jgi:ABC-type transport system involved in multi-copper enzyme maturation permease subunit
MRDWPDVMNARVSKFIGGRRGAVLVLLGAIYTLIGIGYITTPLTEAAADQLHFALTIASSYVWGYLFLITGIVAVISSRWPPGKTTWGYGFLAATSLWWAGQYFIGMVIVHARGSYRGVLSWLALSVMILIISGWEEYEPPLTTLSDLEEYDAR